MEVLHDANKRYQLEDKLVWKAYETFSGTKQPSQKMCNLIQEGNNEGIGENIRLAPSRFSSRCGVKMSQPKSFTQTPHNLNHPRKRNSLKFALNSIATINTCKSSYENITLKRNRSQELCPPLSASLISSREAISEHERWGDKLDL